MSTVTNEKKKFFLKSFSFDSQSGDEIRSIDSFSMKFWLEIDKTYEIIDKIFFRYLWRILIVKKYFDDCHRFKNMEYEHENILSKFDQIVESQKMI